MKIFTFSALALLAFAEVSSGCTTSAECMLAMKKVGISSKQCVNAVGGTCAGNEIAFFANLYSLQVGGSSYGYDGANNIYSISTDVAHAAPYMKTSVKVGTKTCSTTGTKSGFRIFDNACKSGVCNGNLKNCIPLLQQGGNIIASQQCKINGVACTPKQLALEAARFAKSHNAPGYGYTLSGLIYAININSVQVANILNAATYFKIGSATCSGVTLNPFFVFDIRCVNPKLLTTTTTTTTTTTSSTTTPPTTTTTTTSEVPGTSSTTTTTEDPGSTSTSTTTEDPGTSSSTTTTTTEDPGTTTTTSTTTEDPGTTTTTTTTEDPGTTTTTTTEDPGTTTTTTTEDPGTTTTTTTEDPGTTTTTTTEDPVPTTTTTTARPGPSAPPCDPAVAHSGAYNLGGCRDNGNYCYCNAAREGGAYCVDDHASLTRCSQDADCPAGEFCDSSLGGVCDSGKACLSTYAPTKRSLLFGRMSDIVPRVGRMKYAAKDDVVYDNSGKPHKISDSS